MNGIKAVACTLALVAGALGQAPVSAAEEEAPFLGGFLRETRIVYPLAVGDWEAMGEKRYEPQDAGVSVRYARDGEEGWIDVYFYPVGALPPGMVDTLVAQEIDALRQTWLTAPGSGRDISEPGTFDIPMADGRQPPLQVHAVDLTYDYEGRRRSSAMTLLVEQMYAVKGRYTVDASELGRGAVRQRLQRFMAQLQPHLRISSTGGCWDPLPIEQLVDDRPVPEGSVMTIDLDGVKSEVVYPDRVLARDPASASAHLAMLLGMAHAGRMYPGCEGTDPVNPEVPAGKREIRLEYTPAGGGPAPERINRPRRTGLG